MFPKAWPNVRASLMAILTAGSGFILLLLVSRSLPPSELATFNVLWALIFTVSGIFNGASLYVVSQLASEPTKTSPLEITDGKSSPAPAFLVFAVSAVVMVTAATNHFWKAGTGSLLLSEQRIQYVTIICVLAIIQLYLYTLCLGSGKNRGAVSVLYFMEAGYRLVGVTLSLAVFKSEDSLYVSLTTSALLTLVSTIAFMRLKRVGFWPLLRSRANTLMRTLCLTSLGSVASVLLMVGLPTILSFNTRFMQEPASTELLSVIGILRAPVLLPINFFLGLFVAYAAESRHFGQTVVKRATLLVVGVAVSLALAVFLLHDTFMEIMFPTLNETHISAFVLSIIVLGSGSLGVFTIRVSKLLAEGKNKTYTSAWWACGLAQVGVLLVSSDVEFIASSLIATPFLVLLGSSLLSRLHRNPAARN